MPEGLRAVAPEASGRGARVAISCHAGRVSGVAMHLVPGRGGQARLVLAGRTIHHIAFLPENGMPSEWVRVEFWSLEGDGMAVRLRVDVPESVKAGRQYSGQLRLTGGGDSRVQVPVTLDIIDEAPIFRDGFDVDPVIGQFSFVQ